MCRLGYKHTEEAKQKMRISRLGKSLRQETKDKISKNGTGKKRSNECKLHISQGLTGRHLSEEHKNILSEITKNQWKTTPHPRGMLGKKHSKETLEKNSIASISMWSKFSNNKKEQIKRKIMQTRLLKYGPSRGFQSKTTHYSKGKVGKREDLNNTFFRSSWEANYARYLNFLIFQGKIIKWEFEPETFYFEKIKRGTRSYMPDFKVFTNNGNIEYHEVKGWMTDKSATKLKRMAKYYPNIKIILIDKERYFAIKNSVRSFIKNWE